MGMGILVWENVFGWWNPYSAADRALIRRVKPLLQAHADAFASTDWRPLPVDVPGLYANLWKTPEKTVITLLNTGSEDIRGASIVVPEDAGHFAHYDVWNGRVLETRFSTGAARLARMLVDVDALSAGCIVIQPTRTPAPAYSPLTTSQDTPYRTHTVAADHLALEKKPTALATTIPADMVAIPATRFTLEVYDAWVYNEGGCYDFPGDYGNYHRAHEVDLSAYLIDRTEVTNQQYCEFLRDSGYGPAELHNFLKHWEKPQPDPRTWQPPAGKDQHPVVWVDLEDARAYCKWAGKRLPTEAEWQLAAQGTDQRIYPWGNEFTVSCCNHGGIDTSPVDAYPAGASPYGCLDMCGNVWEWTESERNDGHTRYAILKSGSHWLAEGSLWYVASGAQPCRAHQKILLLYPGLDRCATLGFRAVRDLATDILV
jgi:formylglycine-generating enzyme required for sulfatase activity